jgi:hypothetical protein
MEIETQEVLIRVNGEDEERIAVFGLIPDDYEGDLADLPDDEGIYYWLTRQEWESLRVGDEYGDAVITRVGEGEECDECGEIHDEDNITIREGE